ncbi:MAG: hypothetical protein Q7S40_12775 [Opitutaceae bacterium]|nr:hypothetical protein [Opitutaceae bacterium]
MIAHAAEPATPGYDMKEAKNRIRSVEPRMSYLENSEIKVGVNLAIGGAITFLSHRGGPNMINSFDWGRQIQMSFYSGPNPYTPDGKQPHPRWKQLGWNPIQSGDVGGHPSRVLEHRNDGRELYVKCIPMHWPHSGVPGECTYEWTLRLEGPTVAVRARLVNGRPDRTQYPAKSQELPAVYTNGVWYRLYSYTGDRPFTGAPVALIPKRTVKPGEFPWNRFNATEHWAALLDANNRGLGIWAPGIVAFLGGFVGREGTGGPTDGPTGYIAPVRHELLDHDINYDYAFTMIAGSLAEIRDWVYAHAPHQAPFAFDFARDRQHWYPQGGLRDAGWPLSGALRLTYTEPAAKTRVVSPIGFWHTEDLPRVYVRATHRTSAIEAELQFELFGDEGGPRAGAVRFPIRGDGRPHTHEVVLAGAAGYPARGAVRQFFLVPAVNAKPGDTVEIDYIGAMPPP